MRRQAKWATQQTRALRHRALAVLAMAVVLGSAAAAPVLAAPGIDIINLPGIGGSTGAAMVSGTSSDSLGQSVAIIGDINNDGTDDLLIGASATNNSNADHGHAYVVFGRPGGLPSPLHLDQLDGSNGFMLYDSSLFDSLLGWRSARLGDVNGDGRDDFAVSAPYATANGATYAGKVFVVFGHDSTYAFPASMDLSGLVGINGFEIDGAHHDDRAGFDLAGAGDFNGDTYRDIIIGSGPVADTIHHDAYIVYGSATAHSTPVKLADIATQGGGLKLIGPAGTPAPGVDSEAAGSVVAGIGNVNADAAGYDDVAIGAPNASVDGSLYPQGKTWVVFGRAPSACPCQLDLATMSASEGVEFDGSTLGAHSGSALAGIGDINGDSVDDFIIGAPKEDAYAGGVYVVYGNTSLASSTLTTLVDNDDGFHIVNSGGSNSNAGAVVAGAGDVNGDSVADFMIGVPGDTAASTGGSVRVLFGRDAGSTWPSIMALTGPNAVGGGMWLRGVAQINAGDRGDMSDVMAVAGGGDIDHDGHADVLVGAPLARVDAGGDRSYGPWTGAAYVVYGRDGAPDLIFADGFDGN